MEGVGGDKGVAEQRQQGWQHKLHRFQSMCWLWVVSQGVLRKSGVWGAGMTRENRRSARGTVRWGYRLQGQGSLQSRDITSLGSASLSERSKLVQQMQSWLSCRQLRSQSGLGVNEICSWDSSFQYDVDSGLRGWGHSQISHNRCRGTGPLNADARLA